MVQSDARDTSKLCGDNIKDVWYELKINSSVFGRHKSSVILN